MTHTIRNKYLLWIFLSLLAAGLVHGDPADTPEEDSTPQKSGRKAWLVSVSIPKGLDNPIEVMTGKEIEQVTLSKRSVGQAVRIPKDGILRIVRPQPDPVLAETAPYQVLGQVKVPEGVTNALILMVPTSNTVGPGMFKFMVQDLAGFRGGDTLYLNLSSLPIEIHLGKTKLPLKPGSVKIHQPKQLKESTNMPVAYRVYDPQKERWKLLSASTIVMRPTRREICVFYIDERYHKLNYHGVTFPVSP